MQEAADIQSGYLPPVPDFASQSPFGEQLLGSSFIPLTAIPNKYSIDSNWHQVGASKRLLMIAVGRPQPSWRQSGEARKVRAT